MKRDNSSNMSDSPYYNKKTTQTCSGCNTEFESIMKCKLCSNCADEKAMKQLSQIEPPEGGWPKGSDMDMI